MTAPRFPSEWSFVDLSPHDQLHALDYVVVSRYLAHAEQAASEYLAAADDDDREWRIERVRDLAGELRAVADALNAVARHEARLAALRNTAGRTPDEAAAYLAKAEELGRR